MATDGEGSVRTEALGDWQRSCECGAVTRAEVGKTLTLMGWVAVRRDHGGIVFIDLRDRSGIVQIVLDPDESPQAHAAAHGLRAEFVVAVRGALAARPPETINPELPTGEV